MRRPRLRAHDARRTLTAEYDQSPTPPQLILGYGNTSQQAIREGVAILGAILPR
jgi:hypothetical protein